MREGLRLMHLEDSCNDIDATVSLFLPLKFLFKLPLVFAPSMRKSECDNFKTNISSENKPLSENFQPKYTHINM